MSFEENKQMQKRLTLLDQSIDKLRVVYEQYFLGLERFEPAQLRKAVQAELRLLKDNPPKNTAMKFLLFRMETKFRTYEQYWSRVLREIEDGVYERQLQRMKRRLREEGLPDDVMNNVRTKGELEAAMLRIAELREERDAKGPEASPEPTGSKSPQAPRETPKPSGASDPALQKAYESFVRARLSTGESLEGITPERFIATVASQLPRVKKAHGCDDVEIQVVVKDNKATLRFVPH